MIWTPVNRLMIHFFSPRLKVAEGTIVMMMIELTRIDSLRAITSGLGGRPHRLLSEAQGAANASSSVGNLRSSGSFSFCPSCSPSAAKKRKAHSRQQTADRRQQQRMLDAKPAHPASMTLTEPKSGLTQFCPGYHDRFHYVKLHRFFIIDFHGRLQ